MKTIKVAMLFLAALAGQAFADPFPPRGKFIYSDLCIGPEPWRVRGHRVEFVHDRDGDFITIQFSDKGFDSDVLHSPRVEFDAATGALWFAYVDFSDEYAFEGIATPQALTGSFDDDLEVHSLPRVPNSWPQEPPCKSSAADEPPQSPG